MGARACKNHIKFTNTIPQPSQYLGLAFESGQITGRDSLGEMTDHPGFRIVRPRLYKLSS